MPSLRLPRLAAPLAFAAALVAAPMAQAARPHADHLLLVSIAGMHDFDLQHFVAAHRDSALAHLAGRGVLYLHARVPEPSDSFPGILALTTGGLPRLTGVFYDDVWDRALSPAGSDCSKHGGAVPYDEAVDSDDGKLDTTIDAGKLPRDPGNGCKPVWPHQFLRVNTIFDVVKAAGGRTAWGDKHPSYEILKGPSGTGIDDLVTPEIAAGKSDTTVEKAVANDELRVKAVLNQIAGKDSAGAAAPVPTLFGMNFEAVSVAEKYGAGYRDKNGTPSAEIAQAMAATDAALGRMVASLDAAGLTQHTAIIVTAKHGQGPVDLSTKRIVDGKLVKSTIEAAAPGALAYATLDDVGLLWLTDQSKTGAVAAALEAHRKDLGIKRIHSGNALAARFGDPARDSRAPDLVIEADEGVIYTKPTATKIAEHGGLSKNDRRVAILVVAPGLKARVVSAAVETRSVAPTALDLLGLDAKRLDAVAKTHVKPLPELGF
jgi:hypothetical protein